MTETTRVPLGTSDILVHPLNLGGNVFGWTADEKTSFEVLDAYAAAGGNFIDTADVYAAWKPGNTGGESETVIGNWMKARGNRDEIVVATKVGSFPGLSGTSRENVRKAVDESLRRLQSDYIDLYYAHRDFTDRPVEEAVEALNEQVELGKVRTIGVSNITGQRLEQALRFSESENLATYVAVQNKYSLVERADVEGNGDGPSVVDIALAENVSVLPYSALANGFLTGKYRDGAAVDSPRSPSALVYLGERGSLVLAALESVAEAHSSSMSTIALAWLAAQPGVAGPIASARNLEQLPDLLAFTDIHLTDDELTALTVASDGVAA